MIDHPRGRLSGGGKDFVVVECAGVGFRVQVSSLTRADLPPEGESCYLRTFLHMREGGVDLFGFSSETEREIFLAIIGVSGVGPKSAVAILSVMGIAGVLSACAREDAAPFTRVPGIGKKLAQRVALELPGALKRLSGPRRCSNRCFAKEGEWKVVSWIRRSAGRRGRSISPCGRNSSLISSGRALSSAT